MSILLETTFGDLIIDLDTRGSPALCKNVLKLVKSRYYTNTLIYNVVPGKYCQMGGECYSFLRGTIPFFAHIVSFLVVRDPPPSLTSLPLPRPTAHWSVLSSCIHSPPPPPPHSALRLDPRGDGTGGCSIYGLIDAYSSSSLADASSDIGDVVDVSSCRRRFLRSVGRYLSSDEVGRRGIVVAMEMGRVADTIGSQFLITLGDGGGNDTNDNGLGMLPGCASSTSGVDGDVHDGNRGSQKYLSLGTVVEDDSRVLSKLNRSYCDDNGRPYADVRIIRALVIHDPYDDPSGMDDLLTRRGVVTTSSTTNATAVDDGDIDDVDENDVDLIEGYPLAPSSPSYDRPPEEVVPIRIPADDATLFATAGWDDDANDDGDDGEDEDARRIRIELHERQEEEYRRRQDDSRAVVLEMLGDRPSAEVMAPEDVLFVCKLNPLTTDDDLELIFARFDPNAKAEIIRDPDTGTSLQYAFIEFSSKEACNEAYLKMNNALVDDRRIRVDFSQSVSKVWDRYNKRYRMGDRGGGIDRGYMDGGDGGGGRGGWGRGGRGRGPGPGRGYGGGPGRHFSSRDGNRQDHRPAATEHDERGNGSRHRRLDDRHRQDHRVATAHDERGGKGFGRIARHSSRHDEGEARNRHSHDNEDGRSRRRSRSRDAVKGESELRSGSGSRRDNPALSRMSRSRSVDSSSDDNRRKRKKHRKKHQRRRRDDSSRDKERSRSREQEKTRNRGQRHRHHHRRRDDSLEEKEENDKRGKSRHRRRDDSSDENERRGGGRLRRHSHDDIHHQRSPS
jgi:peptidyl-prolyl cis-trans isomerase-like 4